MKQISEKCIMVLACMMLAGCGSKADMYLEQSRTEVSEGEAGSMQTGSDTYGSENPEFVEAGQNSGNSEPAGNLNVGGGSSESVSQKSGNSVNSAGVHQNGSSDKIAVYVCGEVKSPGVYELTAGMRICDAIEAAGGFTKQAGREYWNLAETLTDGQMLCVPTEEEAKKRHTTAEGQQTSQEGNGRQTSGGTGDPDGTLVNINTADAALLTSIPGIGQVRAEAVIAYRQEHGSFQSIEDIKKVSGIGDALFAKMKNHITVS